MKIRVGVDAGRSRLGKMEVDSAGGTRLGPVDVCATADPAAARAAGNPAGDPLRPGGHTPFGTYVLKEVRRVAAELIPEWGDITLVFEPQSGEAREAESYGRLVLVVHGGQPGDDGRLRTTSLGLRVDRATLEQVAAAANRGEHVDLEVHAVPVGFWDRMFFWRRRPSRGFLAADTTTSTDRDQWRSTSSSSSPQGDGYAGKGGQFSGAGASGSWDAPRSAGIAAAGAAALGAGVVAASELGLGADREAPGESSGSVASDTDASDSPASGSSGSETSTSY